MVARLPRAAALLALLIACLSVASAAATASRSTRVQVTFIGDSVPESLDYTPSARRILQRRFSMRFDLRTCRRLVAPSCAFNGSTPPTALQVVEALGPRLGDVLVVDVGYNEGSHGYGRGVDRVMRAARRTGARAVVWVTLRETGAYRDVYRTTNDAIRQASKRWPQLVLADWNAYSAGQDWFQTDGLHLTASGAESLAAFLRAHVLQAAHS